MVYTLRVKAKSEPRRDAWRAAETTVPTHVLDVQGVEISPIWQAEFRGFFWGEGTIAINHARGRFSFANVASIGLRSDDAPILLEFQRRLGGCVRIEKYRDGTAKTITRWVVGVAKDCQRVGEVLAGGDSGLPFLKKRQLDIWRTAVSIKVGGYSGTRYSERERDYLVFAAAELQRLRKWVSNN